MTIYFVLAAFALGVLVGPTVHEGARVIWHKTIGGNVRLKRPECWSDLVVRVLLFALGVMLIVTNVRSEQARSEINALSACQERATKDSLTLWQSWDELFSQKPNPDTEKERREAFFDSLHAYIDSLKLLQLARDSDDPAAVCSAADAAPVAALSVEASLNWDVLVERLRAP